MNKIQTLLSNKHTSTAGLVYMIAKAMAQLANVWFPGHEKQVHSTVEIIEALAIGYGLISAGDASQGQKRVEDLRQDVKEAVETGNTQVLTKQETK